MKNKVFLLVLIAIMIFLVTGCSNTNESDENMSNNPIEETDYSAKENVIAVELEDGKIGEQIVGTLSVAGSVDMCAVDAKIFYDTSTLKLKALESDNADVIMHEKSEDGTININFMRIKNVTETFELCSFTFEVITSDTTESKVSVDVKEVVKVDGDDIVDCPYTTVNGTAYLN